MTVRIRLAELHAQKEMKEKRRISFAEAAKNIGITRQTFSAWYNNEVGALYPDMIAAFCEFYECSIDELLELEQGEGQVLAVPA